METAPTHISPYDSQLAVAALAPDDLPVPARLSLCFSTAAHHRRIARLLDPDVKRIIDPHPWVVKRNPDVHMPHVNSGAFALLVDPDDNVRAMTSAYATPDDGLARYMTMTAPGPCEFREVGTSLTALNGGTGSIVIAAATIKALVDTRARCPLVTEIMPDNEASMSAYRRLGFVDITDHGLRAVLHRACNAGIDASNKGNPTDWLVATPHTVANMADALMRFEERGIRHKGSGHIIEVDISPALAAIGLTKQDLQAMSRHQFPVRNGVALSPPAFSVG